MPPALPRTVVFADDLTGALEMGVLARRGGHRAVVCLHTENATSATHDAHTIVLDTATRELPALEAIASLRMVLATAPVQSPLGIFKKTDSLLRGHIAGELALLTQFYPDRPLVYVPAYPLVGRIVRDGHLLAASPSGWQDLGSIPAMLSSAFHPSDILHIADPRQLAEPLHVRTHRVLVCDGHTQDIVDTIGQLLHPHVGRLLIAGPAGVFRALYGESGTLPVVPRLPTGVAFIGSTHPATIAQFEAIAAVSPHRAIMATDTQLHAYVSPWMQARDAREWLVLRSVNPSGAVPHMHFLPLPEALYLSGGATAAACLRLLNCSQLEPICELEPGVVYSEAFVAGGRLPVITKSGAFGDAQTLSRILAMLQGRPMQLEESST